MLKRAFWFLTGAVTGVGMSIWAMASVARARETLTPTNLRRMAVRSFADVLEGAGTRLRSPNGRG